MTSTPSPSEVLTNLVQGISEGRRSELAELYADDAVVQHMFSHTEPRRWQGREQLRQHFTGMRASAVELTARNLVVHQTSDPEVVVGEWDYHGKVVGTGQTFEVANVIVMRVRDGRIVTSRDYHDHAAIAAALAASA